MSTKPTSALIVYFNDYEQYHQTKGNKLTHVIGIPLVLFSLVGLLGKVVLWSPNPESLFSIDLGILLVLAATLFSVRVDYKIGIPFSLFAYLNYLVSRHMHVEVLVGLQIFGWVLQLYGHHFIEKKAPAFLNSIEHVFIGPMWIFSWLTGYYQPST